MTNLIAVIHYLDDKTSLLNAEIAAEADFKGVCLIHMNGEDEKIENSAVQIKTRFPNMLVFTNRLNLPPYEMIIRDFNLGLDGSWSDNPGVSSTHITSTCRDIQHTLKDVWDTKSDYLFFGSVAFKYQEFEPYPDKAAFNVCELGWVATTSGPETGQPPLAEKLIKMKRALGKNPLAVASGISPENSEGLLPHVDWAFIATGISSSFYKFDTSRTKLLKSMS